MLLVYGLILSSIYLHTSHYAVSRSGMVIERLSLHTTLVTSHQQWLMLMNPEKQLYQAGLCPTALPVTVSVKCGS